jgi:hypothetical protein
VLSVPSNPRFHANLLQSATPQVSFPPSGAGALGARGGGVMAVWSEWMELSPQSPLTYPDKVVNRRSFTFGCVKAIV